MRYKIFLSLWIKRALKLQLEKLLDPGDIENRKSIGVKMIISMLDSVSIIKKQ